MQTGWIDLGDAQTFGVWSYPMPNAACPRCVYLRRGKTVPVTASIEHCDSKMESSFALGVSL